MPGHGPSVNARPGGDDGPVDVLGAGRPRPSRRRVFDTGSSTSNVAPETLSTGWPPMKCWQVGGQVGGTVHRVTSSSGARAGPRRLGEQGLGAGLAGVGGRDQRRADEGRAEQPALGEDPLRRPPGWSRRRAGRPAGAAGSGGRGRASWSPALPQPRTSGRRRPGRCWRPRETNPAPPSASSGRQSSSIPDQTSSSGAADVQHAGEVLEVLRRLLDPDDVVEVAEQPPHRLRGDVDGGAGRHVVDRRSAGRGTPWRPSRTSGRAPPGWGGRSTGVMISAASAPASAGDGGQLQGLVELRRAGAGQERHPVADDVGGEPDRVAPARRRSARPARRWSRRSRCRASRCRAANVISRRRPSGSGAPSSVNGVTTGAIEPRIWPGRCGISSEVLLVRVVRERAWSRKASSVARRWARQHVSIAAGSAEERISWQRSGRARPRTRGPVPARS